MKKRSAENGGAQPDLFGGAEESSRRSSKKKGAPSKVVKLPVRKGGAGETAGKGAAKAPTGKGTGKDAPAAKGTSPRKTARRPVVEAVPSPAAAKTPAPPAAPVSPPKRALRSRGRRTAQNAPGKQREISVSEFFAKNRHLLGFDNPAKALLTTVKEAVDNSLDACEEANILPEIRVRIEMLAEDRFRVTVRDNGPGIDKKEVPRIFGSLLYGSKFHRLRQSRGQQGIGISAAGMYGQMTTGKPMEVLSRITTSKPANRLAILLDTKKNLPVIAVDEEVDSDMEHGTEVAIELEATYKAGRHSVDSYLHQVALASPHAEILYEPPKGESVRYARAVHELPPEAAEIKPHPKGVELGSLMKMLKETRGRNVRGFLTGEFSRVSGKVAEEILAAAGIAPSMSPGRVHRDAAETLYRAIQKTKIMNPPTNCLSPIGEAQLIASLASRHEPEFVAAVSRPPSVYRGNPFLIEAAIAFGGPSFDADGTVDLYRFANRVPLQYQKSACAITKSVIEVAWRNYNISQSRGALPTGPMAVAVHIASVWVPFTSESKEAIASYPEITKEIRLALQECGRKLGAHIRRGRRLAEAAKKKSYIEIYIPHIGIALQEILGLTDAQRDNTTEKLKDILERSRQI
ncbi:MAG: DNA topoisomerase VI subunit B [Candidatus Eisenbacteria bacterium]|nr:DNA topoisomerase VI subunit B [Candidatus Eisenbacteria bacterium]